MGEIKREKEDFIKYYTCNSRYILYNLENDCILLHTHNKVLEWAWKVIDFLEVMYELV